MFVIFLGCEGVAHLDLVLSGFKKRLSSFDSHVMIMKRGKEKCLIHTEE